MFNHEKLYKKMQENLSESMPNYADGKSPLEMMESQTDFLGKTSKEIRSIAESAKSIAENSKTQSDIAIQTSKKADIKGWISVIISIFCAFVELCVHHVAISDFIHLILAK